ncbi:DUF1725 domain-containing protein [Bacillus vallismortis]|uniref:DUF1725 domain-containing protein n=1 Tax=Bacillus vallismortis TaxID=72361 RepID=UPI00374DDF68
MKKTIMSFVAVAAPSSIDKYPPFASTWMELEGIMLSEVSQSESDKHYMFSFICGI